MKDTKTKGVHMAVLFCDTDCELWYTTANELGLKVIGMPYTVNGVEKLYDLGENTDFIGFFDEMKAGATVTTSGLNFDTYVDIFEPYFKAGQDILYIAFSSKMSGTFGPMQQAVDALSEKYPTVRFRKFDTLNICLGAGLLVYLGAKEFIKNGGDIDKTYDYLESIINKVAIYFVVDDLKYLARGGRLSPSKAAFGNLMQLKPILRVGDEGEIDVYSKQQGSKKALKFMVDEFKKKYSPYDNAPVFIVGANNDKAVDEVKAQVKEFAPDAEILVQPIGPVIGAHCGPGTCGIIYPSVSR
jgi:DegV family protein with EDD domain